MMTEEEIRSLSMDEWQTLVMSGGNPASLASYRARRARELEQLNDMRPHPQSHAARHENPLRDAMLERALRLW
jgi:hypothetical protein